MPDLPEELRALLHDRADDAPAVPAPTDRLVRTVRRRQAVRTSLAIGGATLGVVALVAVTANAVRPERVVVAPVRPEPTTTAPIEDKYEFCTVPVYDDLRVSAHPTEVKFQYGCYRVAAGATKVTFTNPAKFAHNLVIARDGDLPFSQTGERPLWTSAVIGGGKNVSGRLPQPLTPGDYVLTCDVHPSMHAQLVVR
jgi:plastocyanin